MLREWIKSLWDYIVKAYGIMSKNVNGKPFTKKSQLCYHLSFLLLTLVIVLYLPQGLGHNFIDYIKDIFAIFVGFFVTVLTFAFDKLDTTPILTQEEKDKLPADKRPTSKDDLKMKQEHNYTIRFFYTVGLIILDSAIVICLLIPNIFWGNILDLDLNNYVFVDSIGEISIKAILLFVHLAGCVLYRMIVIFLTIKVFYYTFYSVSSLLQVLIRKKKLESWN